MDFQLVSDTLLKEFNKHGIRYGIIGGFALGLWEVSRATIDMDFLLLVDDFPKVESILNKFAYQQTFKSENVAQYVSALAPYGQIDFLLSSRRISRRMLERRVRKVLGNGRKAYTLVPEDLVGLKLQAMVNDPNREALENADIASLLQSRKKQGHLIDWELLEDYFTLFERQDQFAQLKQAHG